MSDIIVFIMITLVAWGFPAIMLCAEKKDRNPVWWVAMVFMTGLSVCLQTIAFYVSFS